MTGLALLSVAVLVAGASLAAARVDVAAERAGALPHRQSVVYGLGTNVVTINDPQGKVITERGRGVTAWRKGTDGSGKCVIDVWNAGPGAPPPSN